MSSYETFLSVWKSTILYSNIFDYPLEPQEVYRYAVTGKKIDQKSFESWTEKNQKILEEHFSNSDNYWMLKGRNRLADIRKERVAFSTQKRSTAKRFMSLFYVLPWVRLVAITGTVAAQNATEDADTDIFIITSRRRLWLSRAIILSTLSILGKRSDDRKRNKNGFCINHMLTEKEIVLPDQNMYLANDITRMQVLWSKGDTYNHFIQDNEWIEQYQANWWNEWKNNKEGRRELSSLITSILKRLSSLWFIISAPLRTPFVFLSWIFDVLEKIAKNYQLKNLEEKYPLMRQHKTPLQFHPHDHSDWVLREYYLAIREA